MGIEVEVLGSWNSNEEFEIGNLGVNAVSFKKREIQMRNKKQ